MSLRISLCLNALWSRGNFIVQHVWNNRAAPRRMLKKASLLTRPTPAVLHPPALSLPRQPLRPSTRLVQARPQLRD